MSRTRANLILKMPCSLSLQGIFLLYEQRGWEKFFTVQTKGYMFVVINFTCTIYHDILEESNKYVLYFTLLSINHKFTNWTIDIIVMKLKLTIIKVEYILRRFPLLIMILFIMIAFFLQILALLRIFPLLLSTLILFVAIFIFIFYLNDRKRFKGF
jgi:hypothetical protein